MSKMILPDTYSGWLEKIDKLDDLVTRSIPLKTLNERDGHTKISDWVRDLSSEAESIANRMRVCPHRPQNQ